MATPQDSSSFAVMTIDPARTDIGTARDPRMSLTRFHPGKHLTFHALRGANLARMPQLRNTLGAPIHKMADGSDVLPSQWLQALVGEIGEYANLRKKFERGDLPEQLFRTLAAKELGDIQDYLDVLAAQIGVDLGQATMDKFNEVSERMGSNVRLLAHGWFYTDPRTSS